MKLVHFHVEQDKQELSFNERLLILLADIHEHDSEGGGHSETNF